LLSKGKILKLSYVMSIDLSVFSTFYVPFEIARLDMTTMLNNTQMIARKTSRRMEIRCVA